MNWAYGPRVQSSPAGNNTNLLCPHSTRYQREWLKNQAGVMFSVSRCLDCIAIHRRVSCFVPCNSKHSLIPSIWVHTHSNNPHSSSISPDVLATNAKSFTASVDKNRWNAYRYFRDSRFARVISFLRRLVYFKIALQRRNFFTINPTNDRLKKKPLLGYVLIFPRSLGTVHIRSYSRKQCPYGASVVVDGEANNRWGNFCCTPVLIKDVWVTLE